MKRGRSLAARIVNALAFLNHGSSSAHLLLTLKMSCIYNCFLLATTIGVFLCTFAVLLWLKHFKCSLFNFFCLTWLIPPHDRIFQTDFIQVFSEFFFSVDGLSCLSYPEK